jgi:hypothetical protein
MELKPSGTREQNAVGAWLDRASLVKAEAAFAAKDMPSLLPFFDHFSSAIASFGRCELHARTLDRYVALDLFPDRRESVAAEVKKYNDAGIQQIDCVQKMIPFLEEEVGKINISQRQAVGRLSECVSEIRLAIADWDMKGSDAEKISGVLTEALEAVTSGGLKAIPGYLNLKANELRDLRQRDDRGAVENIPWWKLLIIASMIGWFFLIFATCGPSGCTATSAIFWLIIGPLHLVAFVLFC